MDWFFSPCQIYFLLSLWSLALTPAATNTTLQLSYFLVPRSYKLPGWSRTLLFLFPSSPSGCCFYRKHGGQRFLTLSNLWHVIGRDSIVWEIHELWEEKHMYKWLPSGQHGVWVLSSFVLSYTVLQSLFGRRSSSTQWCSAKDETKRDTI